MREENMSKVWATGYDIPAVKKGLIVKERITHQRTAPIQGYIFNSRRALFKDKRVRRALAEAFDFEWSNRSLFYGQYKRTRSYFGNSELEAKGLPSGAELDILEKYRVEAQAFVDTYFAKDTKPPHIQGDDKFNRGYSPRDRTNSS